MEVGGGSCGLYHVYGMGGVGGGISGSASVWLRLGRTLCGLLPSAMGRLYAAYYTYCVLMWVLSTVGWARLVGRYGIYDVTRQAEGLCGLLESRSHSPSC